MNIFDTIHNISENTYTMTSSNDEIDFGGDIEFYTYKEMIDFLENINEYVKYCLDFNYENTENFLIHITDF